MGVCGFGAVEVLKAEIRNDPDHGYSLQVCGFMPDSAIFC